MEKKTAFWERMDFVIEDAESGATLQWVYDVESYEDMKIYMDVVYSAKYRGIDSGCMVFKALDATYLVWEV